MDAHPARAAWDYDEHTDPACRHDWNPVSGGQEVCVLCSGVRTPARAEDGGGEAWKPSDGDTKCKQCHRPNAPWFAENALWNAVLTDRVEQWLDGEPMGDDPGAILCPSCFANLAAERGVRTVWQMVPQWANRAAPMEFTTAETADPPASDQPDAGDEGWNRSGLPWVAPRRGGYSAKDDGTGGRRGRLPPPGRAATSPAPVPSDSGGMVGTMDVRVSPGGPVPHSHTERVPGCFRCDLTLDELPSPDSGMGGQG